MKLYNLTGACSLVPQIVMEWMGVDYELHTLDYAALKAPEYLAINPTGSVPALTDGNLTLTQNIAILEYLVERNPQAGLHGATPEERANVRRWLAFINADVHKNFTPVFAPQFYSEDTAFQQTLVNKSKERLVQLFAILDKQLEGRDWLTGKRSIADPYLYVVLRWAHFKEVNVGNMANLQRFYQQIEADEGVKRALQKQGL